MKKPNLHGLTHLVAFFPIVAQTILTRQIPLSGEYKINAMVQDNFGFLWLGTDKGLIVYNGYEDEILASLQSFEIVCLKKKGYIYGLQNRTSFKIDAGDHSRIATLPTFTKSKISDIEVRGQDSLWIASYGDGLFWVDHDSLITQVQAIKPKIFTTSILPTMGLLYIASDQGVAFLSEADQCYSNHHTQSARLHHRKTMQIGQRYHHCSHLRPTNL